MGDKIVLDNNYYLEVLKYNNNAKIDDIGNLKINKVKEKGRTLFKIDFKFISIKKFKKTIKNKLLDPLLPYNFVACEYLKDDHTCGAKYLGCKLFTCDYLRKKGIRFRIKDILLLDVFFNPLQKYYIKTKVFTPKEKIIEKLMIL